MKMMKALCKSKREPGIWLEQVPVPTIGADDVLIKIRKTAICGTDLHIYNWDTWAQKTIPVPMHVGHEFVGEIAELGANVKGFNIGDRVSGEGHIVCGHCRNCRGGRIHLCRNTIGTGVNRPGAFAEFLSMPAFNVFKVPDEIPDEIVAFFDPFGNAVHTALSFDLVGEDVLITGAGPVGIMAAAVARHVGARHIVITDINPYRLDLAKQFGATEAMNVVDCKDSAAVAEKLRDVMKKLNMTEGYDVGLEMSGNGTAINAMVDVMNTGGRIALLGLSGGKQVAIDWDKVVFRGLFLKGIYGREMFETWYKMVALLQSGLDLSAMVTHRFPVADYLKGFEAMKSGQSGKVVLDWM
jgi:threonine 3-dehydrogenase